MATRSWRPPPSPASDLSGERQAVPLPSASRQSRTLATSPRASPVARPGLESPPVPGLVCCLQRKAAPPLGAPLEFFVSLRGSVPAGGTIHLHRGVIGIARLDHLD